MAVPGYATGYENLVTQTDEIAAVMSPALVQKPVAANLVMLQDLPTVTDTRKFPKEGSISSQTVAEGAPITVNGTVELTQTSQSCTVIKKASTLLITQKAQRFGNIDLAKGARYVGDALGRGLEDVVFAALDNATQGVTASSVADLLEIEDAILLIRSRTNGISSGRLRSVFDYQAIAEIRKQIIAGANANFSIPSQISLLSGLQSPNGYVGTYGAVDYFETGNVPASATYMNLIFDPEIAICGFASPAPEVRLGYEPLKGDGTYGSIDIIDGWIWCDAEVWNDEAIAYYKTAV